MVTEQVMFHIWKYNERRCTLTLLTKKTISKWDQGEEPAVWIGASSAQDWASRNIGHGNFKVMMCDGEQCGIKDHTLAETRARRRAK